MPRRSRAFKFIAAPPRQYMRKRKPDSAPRLYEWLVDNGYAEPVSTLNRKGKGSRARRKRGRR